MTTLGLDVYGGNGPVNFAKAKQEDRIEFVICKATEGATFNDKRFVDNWGLVVGAGLQPGGYHFARPDNNSATVEAQHFLNVLDGRKGLLALDLETQPKNWPLFELASWATTWLHVVRDATGLIPLLYTYHRWITDPTFEALRCWPLWIPLDPTTPGEITQTARLIGTLGTLDVNTFGGTLTELQQVCGLTQPPAQPPIPTASPGVDMDRLYRKQGDPAGSPAYAFGGNCRVWVDGDWWKAAGSPPITELPASSHFWSLPVVGTQP